MDNILNPEITPPVSQPPSQREIEKSYRIPFIVVCICAVILIGFLFYQGWQISDRNHQLVTLQENYNQTKILTGMCNDGFVKCAAVVSQCKTYISSISNETKFNFNGETNISKMKELPFGSETVYIKVLDDILFVR